MSFLCRPVISDLIIGWATPAAAAYYQQTLLRPSDRERAHRVRSAKAELDWRVSRVLIAYLPDSHRALALSHSRGHAVCVASPNPGATLGADVEHIAPRDVLRLARWVCSEEEVRVLEALAPFPKMQMEHFYLLWTVKEAFIKACDLEFPAGMRQAGFAGAPGKTLRLRVPRGAWWACAWKLPPDKLAAVVWPGQRHHVCRFAWQVGPGLSQPPQPCLGMWHGVMH